MGAKPRNSTPQKVRRLNVLDLSLSGLSLAKIGEKVGVSKSTAKCDLDRALGELAARHDEEAKVLRAKQTLRYEVLLSRVWDRATAGDLQFMDRAISLCTRIDSINGLSSEKLNLLWMQQINMGSASLEQWAVIRAGILETLEPFPEARKALVGSLNAAD